MKALLVIYTDIIDATAPTPLEQATTRQPALNLMAAMAHCPRTSTRIRPIRQTRPASSPTSAALLLNGTSLATSTASGCLETRLAGRAISGTGEPCFSRKIGTRVNFRDTSFDVGLAHFISFTSETDYYQSPSSPFVADLSGNETLPMYNETYITDAGPFGYINGSYKVNQNYEQYQWLKKDLESVNRTKVIFCLFQPMPSLADAEPCRLHGSSR